MITVNDTNVLELFITESVIGIYNANDLLTDLKKAAEFNTKNIELNLNSVKSIDSTGISALVKFVQYLSGSKRTMTLTNAAPDIIKILEVLKLSHFFKLKGQNPAHSG